MLLQGAALEAEAHPPSDADPIRRCEQQCARERHCLPHAAPQAEMELANQRDPYDSCPRHPARASAGGGSHLRNIVMRDQIIGPLRRGIDGK
ncbi:MAG: hypothetical protein DMD35_20560 [Gemmatimonadetes bacterium]|nr:MAG: hypothetical protein DMD35_20560 [Gemmatimonadota bacterium]